MDYDLISLIAVIVLLAWIFISYERKKISIQEIALVATLSALAGIGRVPFMALPNIQPTTFFVIISGYVLGSRNGFVVGAVAAFVSNTFLGHGPWSPWQMAAWGIIGAGAGFVGRWQKKPSRLFLSILAFACGFIFDYFMNLWHWLFFIYPLNIKSFMAVYLASFYFDLMHAISNFIFTYFLGKDFIQILNRFKNRISYKVVTFNEKEG